MKQWLMTAVLLGLSLPVAALTQDDVWIYGASLDRLEVHDAEDEEPRVWEGSLDASNGIWGGHLTSEGERTDEGTEEAEIQLRASRAISAFWNLEAGWRRDFYPEPEQDWAVLGLEGMLPYHIETELSGYVDDEGDTAFRLEAHYEWLLTQRLVLRPALEVNGYGQDNLERGVGKGVADLEAGLRLRYELHRKIAPYIGVEHKRLYGNTADLVEAGGGDTDDTVLLGGIRLWY